MMKYNSKLFNITEEEQKIIEKIQNLNDTYLYIEYLGNNSFSSNIEVINSLSNNRSCIKSLTIENELYSSEYLNNVTKINTKRLYLIGFFQFYQLLQ